MKRMIFARGEGVAAPKPVGRGKQKIGSPPWLCRGIQGRLAWPVLGVVCLNSPVYQTAAQSVYSTPYTFATLAGHTGSGTGSADGTGSNARFTYPRGARVARAGNVYVSDAANGTIRKMTPVGRKWVGGPMGGGARGSG